MYNFYTISMPDKNNIFCINIVVWSISQVNIETFGISHKCFREVSSEVYEISQLKHL